MKRWLPLIAVALLLTLAGCRSSGGQANSPSPDDSLRDPAAPGPYAVGLRHMTFERATDEAQPRKLDSWIWYPADGSPTASAVDDAPPAPTGGPFPLVIFSHGSNGRPEYQRYFTEHLASWGYVVVAPPHPGNTTDDCGTCDVAAVLASAPQRPVDVRFVIGEMKKLHEDPSSDLGAITDTEHVAVAGHSFGGWTSIFMARDDGVDAVIAMAPGAPQTLLGHASKISIPVLVFDSGKDTVVDPAGVQQLGDAIPQSTPLTFVTFPTGTHLTYIDRCFDCLGAMPQERGHELTNRYATAFLEYYIRGDERYLATLQTNEEDALVTTR
jgi:dienelactone hydrolase